MTPPDTPYKQHDASSRGAEGPPGPLNGPHSHPHLLLAAPMRIEARLVASGVKRAHVHRTGMGPQKAIEAAGRLPRLPGGALLVIGFCGALDNTLQPGEIVLPDEVYTADDEGHDQLRVACDGVERVGDALTDAGFSITKAPIVSVGKLALGQRREQLRSKGALAVDMESAWLAQGASERPFAVVRVVLDTPEKELLRPQMIPVALRVGAVLRRAAKALDAVAGRDGLHTLFSGGAHRADHAPYGDAAGEHRGGDEEETNPGRRGGGESEVR